MNTQLCALPGFMGLSSDWDVFGLKNLKPTGIDSFDWTSLSDWSQKFNAMVKSQGNAKSILMGYSLGGRLALHALIQDPSIWQGGIIISAHPGFTKSEERVARQKVDNNWACRFENEDWESLMKEWNARAVFASGNFHFERGEKNYNRQSLANTLRYGSLGLQKDLKREISQLNIPILWLAGAKDETYNKLVISMELKHVLSRKIILDYSGHRVPWEQPDVFVQHVQAFIETL